MQAATNSESRVEYPSEMHERVASLLIGSKQLTTPVIRGYDFNKGVDYSSLFASYLATGLQASHLAKAISIVNEMIRWRLSDQPIREDQDQEQVSEAYRRQKRCTIYLGYTSNMASCGMRQVIRYLVQHRMVDCVVTSCGGIEEDLMKCMGQFNMGEFNMNDAENRLNGHCRIGNILVRNQNYIKLEIFLLRVFGEMAKEQEKGMQWSPRKLIDRLGKEINNEDSIYYWCWKNGIPVFCPAITDGAIGDVLYTNSYKNELRIDVVPDMKELVTIGLKSVKAGAIIVGGSTPKHHILNSTIWRNGLDYLVCINTGLYEDGSDSGAKISEAYTWAKVRLEAKIVKIFSEASLVLPILVAETFAKYHKQAARNNK